MSNAAQPGMNVVINLTDGQIQLPPIYATKADYDKFHDPNNKGVPTGKERVITLGTNIDIGQKNARSNLATINPYETRQLQMDPIVKVLLESDPRRRAMLEIRPAGLVNMDE